jgi:hypothetical protein
MPQTAFDAEFYAADNLLDAYFAKAFVYRRRADATAGSDANDIALDASVRSHAQEAADSEGLVQSWRGSSFELRAADLTQAGQRFLPQPGDTIREDNGDGTWTIYEVSPLPAARCFEWLDAAKNKLAVFAKQTEPTL